MEKIFIQRKVAQSKKKENVKKYWDKRAALNKNDPSATTNDVYLRELEIQTIIEILKVGKAKNTSILDIGCADGYSAIQIAKALPTIQIIGVDYSKNMIKNANNQLKSKPILKKRIKFITGDVSKLDKVCGNEKYDVIFSDRLLINLDSKKTQHRVITEVFNHLKNNGFYISVENFLEGHKNMNKARSKVGLPEIALRWHNLFLEKKDFTNYSKKYFNVISWKNFASSYYFATRVIYSKMCLMRKQQPNYKHDIHKLAIDLPWFGDFSPVQMVVLKKKRNKKSSK